MFRAAIVAGMLRAIAICAPAPRRCLLPTISNLALIYCFRLLMGAIQAFRIMKFSQVIGLWIGRVRRLFIAAVPVANRVRQIPRT